MSSTTHISPTQDTGGNVNYLPNSCNISDISMISVYWSDIMNKPGFCNVSITGSYNDLLNVPSLSTVAFSGDYNSLSNRPWINSNSNIYNNNQGNVGIGTNNPTEKLHLVGNFSISGDIIPAINSNFNLGSSNYKWKDLYLSGNSIYLDNLIISKNSSNNLEIRDSDNNLRSISLNQLELNDGDNKLRFLYSNGALIFNSNGINIQGVEFSNYSKIIYSNNLYTTSNTIIDYTNYRINNLNFNTGGGGNGATININTDTIQIGTSNKFITSNIYDSNITFMNNLNVNGSYQLNNCNIPFSLMKFTNITTTNGVFTYNASSNDFGYFSFVNSGTITFPQTTACDVLVVGAGGNGGLSNLSGGGGAGEVIVYPSYSFMSGTYNIQVGVSSSINSSNLRTSKITSNNIDLIKANGGGDGATRLFSLSDSGSYFTSNVINDTSNFYIAFTSNTTTLQLNQSVVVDILVVGGGGAGGARHAGGGGAGAVIYLTNQTLNAGTYSITIGNGGIGNANATSTNGSDTSVVYNGTTIYLAKGGGTSASSVYVSGAQGYNGIAGGSSGGAAASGSIQAVLTTNIPTGAYGNLGGTGTLGSTQQEYSGGGGGGAGGVGGNATKSGANATAGNGGIGRLISITGSNIYYGGGGGGGLGAGGTGVAGTGGLGGGGAGGIGTATAASGIPNTGGGGGGSGFVGGTNGISGNGGSGVVIIRYSLSGNISLFATSGGSGGGGTSSVYVNTLSNAAVAGTKWDNSYSFITNGSNGTLTQGGNGGGALSNIGLTTSLITGSDLTIGEGGLGATSTSTPITKITYGSGGDGNGGTGTNGLVIVKVPLNTCNVKFDGFIYSSNIFDLNYNTITLMSFASNQLNASIVNTSNKLIDYDNLIDKPWINSNLIIYNNNQGNVGIGTNNPLSKLDVSGDINFSGTLRLNQRSLPFSVYSNTNILSSNGLFSYIPNNFFFGYYTFLTNGTITFPQTTACDIIVVGAGGNGGLSTLSGGGGAGEVIASQSYSFTTGTYNIQIGTTNDISSSNLRNSIISSNNSALITAKGGGDGAYNFYSISGTGSYITSNIDSSNLYIAFTSNVSTFLLYQTTICDILVVGGGGGGGIYMGSGGGAGGVVYITNYSLIAGSYSIVVGNGGRPMQTYNDYTTANGSNSIIRDSANNDIITALGGAIGASQSSSADFGPPKSGGSGAGGTRFGNTGGAGIQKTSSSISAISRTYGYGNAGGNGTDTVPWAGGGGGGAGGVGETSTSTVAGNGGIGIQIPITGSNTYYGGGGGGGVNTGTGYGASGLQAGTGGLGGGGAGVIGNATATSGLPNTGGGGGGAGGNGSLTGTGGSGGSGIVIIRFALSNITTAAYSGGSGGGGLSSSYSIILSNSAIAGTKWNITSSLVTNGSNGTLTRGGNGGSALSTIGYTETITSNSFVLGVGGLGATSNSVPSLKTTYGSGGDGNGGLGTQGIVIIKVPLNIQRPRFDGYINYSNIDNRPVLNELLSTNNYLNIGYYNQVNFPLGDVSWNNEWFLYIGRSPTSVQNSFIFWHLTSNINSKWWFNGTQTSTNNEISDARIKKEITEIQNPLDKLMLIKPKEYYLCDEKDYLRKYGVIAQDVASNQELSHLVYKDDDFIANVYTTATYVSSPKFLLITTTSIIGKVAVDDELKLLLDNMNIEIFIEETPYHNRYKKRYVKVKEIIDEFTIEIYEEIELSENEKSNILIYGKKVNDFNKLDYSSLYSLNIACTQELYKIIQEQKNKIDELEQRIIQLENR